jgi:hypothetical protein
MTNSKSLLVCISIKFDSFPQYGQLKFISISWIYPKGHFARLRGNDYSLFTINHSPFFALLHSNLLFGPQVVYRRCRAESRREKRPANKYRCGQARDGDPQPVPVDPGQQFLRGIRAADLREAAAVNGCPYLAVAWVLWIVVTAFMGVADRPVEY